MADIEKETEQFFKDAFLVDGEVRIVKNKDGLDFKIGAIIELNDSKRGKFYIARLDVISEDSE